MSNVRSLVNKFDDFKFSVLNDNYVLVCVTETWLNSTYPDTFLLNGLSDYYVLFRNDRSSRIGGCVCIFAKSDLYVIPVSIGSKILEVIAVRLHINGDFYVVVDIYRPPSCDDLRKNYMCDLVEHLNNLVSYYSDHKFLIIGDFNLHLINWSTLSYLLMTSMVSLCSLSLIILLFSLFLMPLVAWFSVMSVRWYMISLFKHLCVIMTMQQFVFVNYS